MRSGTVDADEGRAEQVKFRSCGVGRRGEEVPEFAVQAAARGLGGCQLPGLLAGGASFQKAGSGVEAVRAQPLAQCASFPRKVSARAGQRADEPLNVGDRGADALAGEQLRLACDSGRYAAPAVQARCRLVQCREDRFRGERGLELGHQGEQGTGRITRIGSGMAGHYEAPVIRARFGRLTSRRHARPGRNGQN
jgi:hypothetical protein